MSWITKLMGLPTTAKPHPAVSAMRPMWYGAEQGEWVEYPCRNVLPPSDGREIETSVVVMMTVVGEEVGEYQPML